MTELHRAWEVWQPKLAGMWERCADIHKISDTCREFREEMENLIKRGFSNLVSRSFDLGVEVSVHSWRAKTQPLVLYGQGFGEGRKSYHTKRTISRYLSPSRQMPAMKEIFFDKKDQVLAGIRSTVKSRRPVAEIFSKFVQGSELFWESPAAGETSLAVVQGPTVSVGRPVGWGNPAVRSGGRRSRTIYELQLTTVVVDSIRLDVSASLPCLTRAGEEFLLNSSSVECMFLAAELYPEICEAMDLAEEAANTATVQMRAAREKVQQNLAWLRIAGEL